MRRPKDPHYAGASGKALTLGEVSQLDSSMMLMPKVDGIYGHVVTDAAGKIDAIVTRQGELLGPGLLRHYQGVTWVPDSILVAEVELWTQAAAKAIEARGFAMLHAFDALRVNGRDITGQTFNARRSSVFRAHSDLEAADPDRPWVDDADGNAHDLTSGRFKSKVPMGHRRISLLPALPLAQVERAWSSWVADSSELGIACDGLVAVGDAALGARGAKRKIKEHDSIDAVVTQTGPRGLSVMVLDSLVRFPVATRKAADFHVGQVVSLLCNGFTDNNVPKHARISSVRHDRGPTWMAPGGAC